MVRTDQKINKDRTKLVCSCGAETNYTPKEEKKAVKAGV